MHNGLNQATASNSRGEKGSMIPVSIDFCLGAKVLAVKALEFGAGKTQV